MNIPTATTDSVEVAGDEELIFLSIFLLKERPEQLYLEELKALFR